MVYIGKHITAIADPLQPAAMNKLYKAIINPDSEVAVLQTRLQAIRLLDIQQYRKMKTLLPYIVCAYFHPNIRKKEHFVYTERFIVDIDHLSEYGLDMQQLKSSLREDPRVEMYFTSPGGDGLKIIFSLSEKISDSAYYALFYKSFCLRLAAQYHLGAAIDTKTNDVSRCCFVSHDPDAYYNNLAEKVQAAYFMPKDEVADLPIFQSALKEEEKKLSSQKNPDIHSEKISAELPDDTIAAIKQKIGMRIRVAPAKQYEQPEQLDSIMLELKEQVASVGAEVLASKPISYGRQIRIGAGKHWAEINLFYGHRGVSIVATTKTGSNKDLCESLVLLLKNHFICE